MALPYPEKTSMTEAEYLAFDAENDFKSEFANGQVIVMAGASREHNQITSNVTTELNMALRGQDCDVYPGDMRVRVNTDNAYRYPDVVVVCGTPQFVPDVNPDTLMNPVVLFEMLSESTASVDAIQKPGEYLNIASVRDYIIVAQKEMRVLHYHRQSVTEWLNKTYTSADDVITLKSIDCALRLVDIYRRIEFENE